MKIAIFTGTIDLTKNDARGVYVIEILKHLTKFNDLDITLIAPNSSQDELKNDCIKYIPYTLYDRKHFRYLSAAITSPSKLLFNDYDILHCFGHEATNVALFSQKMKRKKALVVAHFYGLTKSESKEYAKFSVKSRIFRPFMVRKENIILKKSYGKTVLSEAMKDYLVTQYNIPKNKIFVVPIGIDFKVFGKKTSKDLTLINGLGLNNKKIILYSGWISALHGVLDLVKAMEIINTNFDAVTLVIVGFGPLELQVKKYVKKNQINNVVFTGKVPHAEITNYYSIADVLVIPHVRCMQTELNPITKLFEYLGSGKPIVSSNLKPIADVVGRNAVLVEPENPQSLAEGILKLLRDKELRKKLGENGRKLIYDHSWEDSARKQYEAYVSLYDSIKREKNGG